MKDPAPMNTSLQTETQSRGSFHRIVLPLLLDLFCCAGGAGEGYRRAGFDVTGVDIEPQKNNPHLSRTCQVRRCDRTLSSAVVISE